VVATAAASAAATRVADLFVVALCSELLIAIPRAAPLPPRVATTIIAQDEPEVEPKLRRRAGRPKWY
jgi:hypothetical protein